KNDPYKIEIKSITGNVVVADEPLDKGGKDLGFSPKELLAAALSACTSATLRMYIERKGWDVPEINVETELIEVNQQTALSRKIQFTGNLDEAQKTRLLQVANACPVHKILSNPIEFHTEII
ncbi:MAG TPA: OsmC family protein, partial [Bacteroidia bacterium]|nr:OsmC family protein [Bacteroidia bacterium]